jgi:DNA-binding NtrC family response regulator
MSVEAGEFKVLGVDRAYEPVTLAEAERRHILSTLAECKGNKSACAKVLDIDRRTLYRKIERFSRQEPKAATG